MSTGLNQAQFAAAIGVSQGSVSKWEAGKEVPGTVSLFRIAETTGFSHEFLISGKEDIKHEVYEDPDEHPRYTRIPMVGIIEAKFVDRVLYDGDRNGTILVEMPPMIRSQGVSAYQIVGSRSDKILSENDIAVVMDIHRLNVPFAAGDIVLLQRTDQEGLVELSLRRHSGEDGWLWPLTHDPRYQAPVRIEDEANRGVNAVVVGVLISAHLTLDVAWREATLRADLSGSQQENS